ncbi:hypothetical protein CBR_g48750 [Chara braunii]|uniref:Uncharacterized protein n=1 Tax=Chara braunii TaxID=69332 RepID=A0A388K4L6_CHABU|nr:hypothetical protein CBR_g48750 [Chara braunii]|eukprot:GBG65002.1 hypothetical protein CBR_g48750 [Chara braunii]
MYPGDAKEENVEVKRGGAMGKDRTQESRGEMMTEGATGKDVIVQGIQGGGGHGRRGNQGGGGRRDEDGTSGQGGGRGGSAEGVDAEGDGERERRRRREFVAPSCRLAASDGTAGFNTDPPRMAGNARAGGASRGSGAATSSSSFDVDRASDSSSCDSPVMAMRPGSSSDGSSPFSRWALQNSSKSDSELSGASSSRSK